MLNSILLTIDRAYLMPTHVLLASLFYHNPNVSFAVHILHSDLTGNDLRQLARFVRRHGAAFHSYTVDPSPYRTLPGVPIYTTAAYYKLSAPHILPMDTVLYLDADMLVLGDITDLLNQQLNDRCYGVVPALPSMRITSMRGYDGPCFNAGLLLMNLKALRSTPLEDLLSYAQARKDSLTYADQDLINLLYGDKVLQVDKRFNVLSHRHHFDPTATIVHFVSKDKPWLPTYGGAREYFFLYARYGRMTRYRLHFHCLRLIYGFKRPRC